ncbi:DUF3558 family protein [Streptomyces resistomycificus]|uniref:Membrane protein n=2 Tax=Streptomyces resistomycificus TaxID=67356 RepID=A0A0L8KRI7_9ACTN|nr:DUF3558 family protein [Streptomyces resistomycificus]KOG28553.1 membrane protein [Streptomyces resistomycificus]KUN91162.1 hypothetical protein AQJ84_36840 [Streptomyces resistomycificus]
MQRPAQVDQRDERDRRAKRLHRVLVGAAAVPVMLIAAGCSSDSGSEDAGAKSSGSPEAAASASASPTVQAAAYKSLPEPCGVLSKKTLGEMVPKASKSGKEGTSDDTSTRGSCSWSSLDNNGVKGSQFRWLNISLLRFESDTSRGSGEDQAQAYYEKQVQDAQSSEGAKNAKSQPLSGTGDAATTVTYDLKKKEGSFKQQTVVTRVENVVVSLDYNGAGLAGEKTPSAATLTKLAEKAAKEAVASVSSANGEGSGGGTGSGSGTSPSPSKSASKSPSQSPEQSESKSASPTKSAAKKS